MLRLHPAYSEVLCELVEDYRQLTRKEKDEILHLIRFEREMQGRGLVRDEPPALLRILGQEYIPAQPCDDRAISVYDLLVEAQVIDTLDATYGARRDPCVTYWIRYTG